MSRKIIFEKLPGSKHRRTDPVYIDSSLPDCIHPYFSFDKQDEVMKCISCEMEMLFQNMKMFNKMEHRYIENFDFKTHKFKY